MWCLYPLPPFQQDLSAITTKAGTYVVKLVSYTTLKKYTNEMKLRD